MTDSLFNAYLRDRLVTRGMLFSIAGKQMRQLSESAIGIREAVTFNSNLKQHNNGGDLNVKGQRRARSLWRGEARRRPDEKALKPIKVSHTQERQARVDFERRQPRAADAQ